MEDLIAIQSKSIAELREIAKVLGITDEKLSKKELLAKITAIATSNENPDSPKEDVATEVAAPAPQKRKRARLGSVKVEAAKPSVTPEKEEDASTAEADKTTETPIVEVKEEVAPQPKKRGRKPKSANAAEPQATEVIEKAESEVQLQEDY